MNGTPAKDGVGNENKERGNIAYKIQTFFSRVLYLPIFHYVYAEPQLRKWECLSGQEQLDHLYTHHIVQEQLHRR